MNHVVYPSSVIPCGPDAVISATFLKDDKNYRSSRNYGNGIHKSVRFFMFQYKTWHVYCIIICSKVRIYFEVFH